MDRYFKANENSLIFKTMKNYSAAMFILQQKIKEFYKKHELDGEKILPMSNTVGVQGTENNMKYKKFFKKEKEEDLYVFRLNSKFAKEWKEIYEKNNLKESNRNQFHLSILETFNMSLGTNIELAPLYDVKNKEIYLKIHTEKNFDAPADIIEIKASEFYLFVENYKKTIL